MTESEITQREVSVSQCINALIEKKLPFAIYRLPLEDNINFVASLNPSPIKQKIDFEEIGMGFTISPFDGDLPYFIQGELIGKISGNHLVLNEYPEFFSQIYTNDKESFSIIKSEEQTDEKYNYINTISSVIDQIKAGKSQKVVISRKKHLGSLSEKNYFKGYTNLTKAYPSAMVSMVYLPWLNQIWMGATPEILVSQNRNGIFKTVALAGTQSALNENGNEIKPIDALWSHKEIEEQALVSRYIINCLKKIRVREFDEYGPKTIKAGNLLHLNTSFLINTKEINFPNISSVMLELLHPTAAVCGLPKESSLQIINETEQYNREMYAGYLGPINIEGESHIFVNLRTMKIQDNEIYAFAGGGITEDSIPEKEWNETQIKLQTIQKSFA